MDTYMQDTPGKRHRRSRRGLTEKQLKKLRAELATKDKPLNKVSLVDKKSSLEGGKS